MAMIQWMQPLLEIERRESARQQLLLEQAPAIFEMLTAEVTQCIAEWNAAHAGDKAMTIEFGSGEDPLTMAIPDQLILTYEVKDARIDFEFPGKPHLPKTTATVALRLSPAAVAAGHRARYSPLFTIKGQPGQLTIPALVEYLLKPLLFPSDLIARLPPSPARTVEPPAGRDAERRRAAATQPFI